MSTNHARRWTAAAMALLGGVAAGSAQDAPPSKVLLAFALEPGRVVRFVLTTGTESGDTEMDRLGRRAGLKPPDRKVVVRTEFSVEVLKVLPDGKRTATIRFGRITATVPSIVGEPVEVSSDRALPDDPMLRINAIDALALAGLSCPAEIDARGTVVRVEVSEGARAAAEKRLRMKKEEGAYLIGPLAPDRIAGWVNRAWGAAPLPGKEVAVGQTWEVRVPSSVVHPGGELLQCQTLKVAAVDAGEIRLEGKGEVKVVARNLPKEFADLVGTVVVTESAVSSNLRLLSADGLPHAGTGEVTVALQEKMGKAPPGRTKTVRTTSAIERVEAWPSEAKGTTPATPK